jgi:hypothetical protein
MSLYANSSPREDALLNQLSQAMSDVNAHLQKATDLSRAGNSAAFAEELDQANGVLRKARVLADQLFTAQQDRMKEGMKILLQTHDYAEAWNSSVAIIRKEEMAAFASAQAEHDRVEAQFKLNHNDSAMLDRMQAADDRLRKAQVEAMERATKQLRAAANHLLDLSTGR